MTARMGFEELLEAKDNRREKADQKAYDRLGRRMEEAEHLIGELCREGKKVFYINIKSKSGRPTGATKDGSRSELIAYLLRNNYV